MLPLNLFEPGFAPKLSRVGLSTFDDFWNLEWNWVEPRNERRDGWSGAARVTVDTADGPLALFVKRQENHCYRSLHHPFRGLPTFYREWCNIQRLRRGGVATLDPVYYGQRVHQDRYQAILITQMLEGFSDLDRFFAERDKLNDGESLRALQEVARVLLCMHRNGFQHNCLGGNHIMLRMGEQIEVRLLDLEKMKATRNVPHASAKDLARLIRHTPTLHSTDHRALISAYAKKLRAEDGEALVRDLNRALDEKHRLKGRAAHPFIVLDKTV